MSELLYGIVNSEGNLVAVSHNPESVATEANRIAKGKEVIDMTAPSEARKNRSDSDYTRAPQQAFKATTLPKVSKKEVMALTLKEAFTRLRSASVLDKAPKTWQEFKNYPEVATLSSNEKMSKDVEKAFQTIGVVLEYSGYPPESTGLSLSPHNLAWKLTPQEEEAGVKTRTGLLPKVIQNGRKLIPNLCAFSTSECRTGCLVLTGQSGMGGRDLEGRLLADRLGREARRYTRTQTIKWQGRDKKVTKGSVFLEDRMSVLEQTTYYAKIRRTALLFHDPVAYCRMLVEAIRQTTCKNPNTHIRLNVLSDIPWEVFFPDLFKMFPEIQFYDYTKVPGRKPPKNYTLVFSYSGKNSDAMMKELESGTGCAVVIYAESKKGTGILATRGAKMWEQVNQLWGYPTINGDLYDIRSYDRPALEALGYPRDSGYIISLRYKAPKIVTELGAVVPREDMGAFVVDVMYDEQSGVFFGPETAAETSPERMKKTPRGGRRNPPAKKPPRVKWLD